eukprot:m.20422 g.20422  ORF g.20422 m.20422 type:complete len:269 (+) comp12930_c1_seq1:65-871(+)
MMPPVLSSMHLSHTVKSKLSKHIHDLVSNSPEIDRNLLRGVCHALTGVDPSALLPGGIPSDKAVELWGNDVQYFEIARTTQFSVAVFLVKKGGTIPLHDHPRMNVVSRLLFGELRERSYDWEDTESPTQTETSDGSVLTGLAHVSKNEVRTVDAKQCALIEPCEGNLHEVVAESTCAFLDCFLPPYEVGRRDCTYYRFVSDGTTATPTPNQLQQGTRIKLESYDPEFFTADYLTTVTGQHRPPTPNALQTPTPQPNTSQTPTPRPLAH